MTSSRVKTVRAAPWVDPLHVAAGIAHRDGAFCLLSDPGVPGSRSFIGVDPDRLAVMDRATESLFDPLATLGADAGVLGLAAYDAGARPATGERPPVWPDLILARYPALLAFDHDDCRVRIIGWGEDEADAGIACDMAMGWMSVAQAPALSAPPAATWAAEAPPEAYLDAVVEVVERIAAGDLFQANIARAWSGALRPDADPFDVFLRLALDEGRRAAPYGAFWRTGDRALVSNSPELFLTAGMNDRRVETRPIKGTRPRDEDPAADVRAAQDLFASAKDRAENLMIVDLMRNDLARACVPGTVAVDRLFEVESHATVHHLVSTVTGTLAPGLGAAELLEATFPPGSITGAPKHQAMKVIAELEPPRGAWCGSLFLLDEAGDLTASVLIRTISFQRDEAGWRYRTLAGAGIVADSDPSSELDETTAKIAAVRAALTGDR